jgi:hypothetical protein
MVCIWSDQTLDQTLIWLADNCTQF